MRELACVKFAILERNSIMNSMIKSFAITSLFLTSTLASAASSTNPIRTCNVKVPVGSTMKIELFQTQAVTTQNAFGTQASHTDKLEMVSGPVRPNLQAVARAVEGEMHNPNSTTDSTVGLSQPELYVMYSMLVLRSGFPGTSAGFNLNLIRSAQLFLIGDKSNMGQAAVIVGLDANGKELGAFLGGLSVSACMK